ncbi:MAG: NAD(P)H-hydrate dehydratase [Candidatus Omnitrophica bacterium]|nr:NAD(P)H-hydrate dehydratase [Candidatus Omnitrophota bacterium]MDD5671493.1 NAD(P)H-hydrate dehydratase [Candidatus Omnitrophota bacterium]
MSVVEEIRKKWRPRKRTAHKGDFGQVFILAGSKGLAGAAHLAGMGAMRSGAGLVTVGVPGKIYSVIARREEEIMVRPFSSTPAGALASRGLKSILPFAKTQDVLALGPGMSQNSDTQRLIRTLIQKAVLPFVIDADGLNALKGHIGILRACRGRAVLTPHPGEFVRLFGGKLSAGDAERRRRAREEATRHRVFIVLKGHHTVIAGPDGKVSVNRTGNPGMATGGMGDVLTGIIASLIGQRFSLWDAARFGVLIHGVAGDLAAREVGEISLIAGDLLKYLPTAIRRMTSAKGKAYC